MHISVVFYLQITETYYLDRKKEVRGVKDNPCPQGGIKVFSIDDSFLAQADKFLDENKKWREKNDRFAEFLSTSTPTIKLRRKLKITQLRLRTIQYQGSSISVSNSEIDTADNLFVTVISPVFEY